MKPISLIGVRGGHFEDCVLSGSMEATRERAAPAHSEFTAASSNYQQSKELIPLKNNIEHSSSP
jgi:hypothetical protein